jgi:hypothetical protein
MSDVPNEDGSAAPRQVSSLFAGAFERPADDFVVPAPLADEPCRDEAARTKALSANYCCKVLAFGLIV